MSSKKNTMNIFEENLKSFKIKRLAEKESRELQAKINGETVGEVASLRRRNKLNYNAHLASGADRKVIDKEDKNLFKNATKLGYTPLIDKQIAKQVVGKL